MLAHEIIDRLAERHAKDLFVPECKDGPTQGTTHLRLDAWAMRRSWSNHCTFGYEVKVSRADFLRDEKMRYYLPLCHEFYVVCPAGVVQSLEELPEGAGLLIASPNHGRLVTKRKATYREIEEPNLVYRYVLMARARIEKNNYYIEGGKEAFWKHWLETKEINSELGWHVGQVIRERIRHEIEDVRSQNEILKHENESLQEIKKWLEELGIERRFGSNYGIRERLEAYKAGFPEDLRQSLNRARNDAQALAHAINEAEKALGGTAS